MLTELTLDQLLVINDEHYIGEGHFVTIDSHQYSFIKGLLGDHSKKFLHSFYAHNKINQSGTYILQEINTGLRYIGSSGKLYLRIKKHKDTFSTKKHHNRKFLELINKSNISNFEIIIIFTNNREEAYDLEQFLIDFHKESGMLLNLEYNARYPQLGVKLSDERKKLLSIANTGKSRTEEQKKKLSIFHKNSEVCIANRKKLADMKKRKVMVYGTEYSSMKEAVEVTGINRCRLEKCLKKKDSGVYWIGTNVSPVIGLIVSEQRRKKISESKRKNPRTYEHVKKLNELLSKKIVLNGKLYSSIKEATIVTGITRKSIYRQLLKNKQILPDGTYVLDHKKYAPKKIIINNIVYDSARQASTVLSINLHTLRSQIKSGAVNYYYDD